MAQNQYIPSPNGAVYGHVVPQVYPPPQAYAAPQHQQIPPQHQQIPPQHQQIPTQAIPPQALPPQALPPQSLPPQAIPTQALPQHSYHHPTPTPQHQSPYVPHVSVSIDYNVIM
jgi:signal transducing adaptor molecule